MLLETRTFREIWTTTSGCQGDGEGELVTTSAEGCGPGGPHVAGGPHGWYWGWGGVVTFKAGRVRSAGASSISASYPTTFGSSSTASFHFLNHK